MLELLSTGLDSEIAKNLLSAAASAELTKTLAIFGFAAWIHSGRVKKEISKQFGALISVLREDLDAQKSVLAGVVKRVDNIEAHLIRGKE